MCQSVVKFYRAAQKSPKVETSKEAKKEQLKSIKMYPTFPELEAGHQPHFCSTTVCNTTAAGLRTYCSDRPPISVQRYTVRLVQESHHSFLLLLHLFGSVFFFSFPECV